MPVLSKFYGIVIRMLGARQLTPRFHAFYGGSELVVGLNPPRILGGTAPSRVSDLVLEWCDLHQQELLAAWKDVLDGDRPISIAPLE